MNRYFIVDALSQSVVNTIVWDGQSEYKIPEYCILILVTEETIMQYAAPHEEAIND